MLVAFGPAQRRVLLFVKAVCKHDEMTPSLGEMSVMVEAPALPHAALLEAARTGDRQALERLLAAYQPTIRRFAQSQCATTTDAEDAAQETMLQVYRRLGTLRAAEALPGWLFTTVKRECYRMFRRMFGRHEVLDEDSPLLMYHSTDALKQDVVAAIEALPPIYRSVILMHDLEQRTAVEIAHELSLTVEAVKSRVHRGRKLMRAYLGD